MRARAPCRRAMALPGFERSAVLLCIFGFATTALAGSLGGWGLKSGLGGIATEQGSLHSRSVGANLRLKGGMDDAAKAARAARAARAKEQAEAAKAAEEEKAAAAAASGRPADDSDSEEDVAAKMSKMSVNDLAKKDQPREGMRDGREKQVVGLEGRARRLAEKVDEKAQADEPHPAKDELPPPPSPVLGRVGAKAMLEAMPGPEKDWSKSFSGTIMARGQAPVAAPSSQHDGVAVPKELAEALAADAKQALEDAKKQAAMVESETIPELEETREAGMEALEAITSGAAANKEEGKRLKKDVASIHVCLAQARVWLARQKDWIAASEACEGARGASMESRARARAIGGMVDRACWSDMSDVRAGGKLYDEIACPTDKAEDLADALAKVSPGGCVTVKGGRHLVCDGPAIYGGLGPASAVDGDAIEVIGTGRGSNVGGAAVCGSVLLGRGRGGKWSGVGIVGRDSTEADAPVVAWELGAVSVWGSEWDFEHSAVSCAGGRCIVAADSAKVSVTQCVIGGGEARPDLQNEREKLALEEMAAAGSGQGEREEGGGEDAADEEEGMVESLIKQGKAKLGDGPGCSQDACETGVLVLGASLVTATDCAVRGCRPAKGGEAVSLRGGSAFVVVESGKCALKGCTVSDSHHAAHLDDDADMSVDDCTVEALSGAAFHAGPKASGVKLGVSGCALSCAPYSGSQAFAKPRASDNYIAPRPYFEEIARAAEAAGQSLDSALAKEDSYKKFKQFSKK